MEGGVYIYIHAVSCHVDEAIRGAWTGVIVPQTQRETNSQRRDSGEAVVSAAVDSHF